MGIDSKAETLVNKTISASNNTIQHLPTSSLNDGAVTNAKLANMAQATVKGRASGAGTGVPTDLTATQLAAILMGRRILTANETVYFRSGGTGAGLGATDDATAWGSFPDAYDYVLGSLYDNGYTVTIKQGSSGVTFPTTYTFSDTISLNKPMPGGGQLVIEGRADPDDVILDHTGAGIAIAFANQFSNKVTFRGFTIDSDGTIGLRHTAVGRLEIDDLVVKNATGTLVSVQDFGAQLIHVAGSVLDLIANASGTGIALQSDAGSTLNYGQVRTNGDFGTVLDVRFGSTVFSDFQWDDITATTGTQADVREGCSVICGTDSVINHFTGDAVPVYRGSGIISDGAIFACNRSYGTKAFAAATTAAVTLPFEWSNGDYNVHIDSPEDNYFWVTDKTATGFTINAKTSTSATVGWTAEKRV